MTTVNVTTTTNTVHVTGSSGTVVVETPKTSVVTATTVGPQGASTDFHVNDVTKVDKSLIYYDAASAEYRADDSITFSSVVKGGSF
tara:strand:+ start:2420 stop:2677 length:258 start_codon:yes stop_codon:yes gene_type:complete